MSARAFPETTGDRDGNRRNACRRRPAACALRDPRRAVLFGASINAAREKRCSERRSAALTRRSSSYLRIVAGSSRRCWSARTLPDAGPAPDRLARAIRSRAGSPSRSCWAASPRRRQLMYGSVAARRRSTRVAAAELSAESSADRTSSRARYLFLRVTPIAGPRSAWPRSSPAESCSRGHPDALIASPGGALLIAGACACWALDNNFTRKVSRSAIRCAIAALKGHRQRER